MYFLIFASWEPLMQKRASREKLFAKCYNENIRRYINPSPCETSKWGKGQYPFLTPFSGELHTFSEITINFKELVMTDLAKKKKKTESQWQGSKNFVSSKHVYYFVVIKSINVQWSISQFAVPIFIFIDVIYDTWHILDMDSLSQSKINTNTF